MRIKGSLVIKGRLVSVTWVSLVLSTVGSVRTARRRRRRGGGRGPARVLFRWAATLGTDAGDARVASAERSPRE